MGRKTDGTIIQRGDRKTYCLRYMAHGAARRVRLLDLEGRPIYGAGPNGEPLSKAAAAEARKAAEGAAARHLAPLREGDKVERLRLFKNDLADAEAAADEAEANDLNAAASIPAGFDLFMACPKRPASCKRYKTAADIPTNTTAACYRAYYGRFAAWLKKRHPKTRLLSEVTDDIAAAFMDDVADAGASGTTHKYATFFRCLFATLADAGKIALAQNPFRDIEPPAGESHSKRPLSREQIAALLAAADGELRVAIGLGYFCGLRQGDAFTLRWGEVDMDRRIITRVPAKTARTAKGKTAVVLGIPPALAAMLADLPRAGEHVLPDLADRYHSHRMKAVHAAMRRLFENIGVATVEEGTGSRHHYIGKRKVYDASRRAQVTFGFHSLRHSFVSHSIEAGTPALAVQAAAGHTSATMTAHYLHTSDAAARQYAAALDLPAATPAARDMVIDLEPADPDTASDTPTGARAQLRRIIDTMTEDQLHDLLASMKGRA